MGWFTRKIRVSFIDADSGAAIARASLTPEALPESFAARTTLHLSGADWLVESADAADRAEYARRRRLTLRLRRLAEVNPSDLLYSVPSICDAIPAIGSGTLTEADPRLHEDDWRQLELVAREHAGVTLAQFAAIRRVHEDHAAEVGWTAVHVRSEPEPPIPGSLTLDDLRAALTLGGDLRGISYLGAEAAIADGFSIATADGLTVYGLAPGGRVTVLGIVDGPRPSAPERSIADLVGLAERHALELVRWCRGERAVPSPSAFREMIVGAHPPH